MTTFNIGVQRGKGLGAPAAGVGSTQESVMKKL